VGFECCDVEPSADPLMVVVDTNILVDVLRGVAEAVAVLEHHAAEEVVVPSMVRFELLAGARPSEMASITSLLDVCIDAPVDGWVADAAAALARRYMGVHSGIDYVVAATAQLLDAQLVTRNVKHFPMFAKLKAPY
jgi:predicted nucleic acid-binding protein